MQDISGGRGGLSSLIYNVQNCWSESAQCWRCQTWDGDASGVEERGERGEGPTVIGLYTKHKIC